MAPSVKLLHSGLTNVLLSISMTNNDSGNVWLAGFCFTSCLLCLSAENAGVLVLNVVVIILHILLNHLFDDVKTLWAFIATYYVSNFGRVDQRPLVSGV